MIDVALRDLEQSVIGSVLNRPDTLALLPSLSSTDFALAWSRAAWDAIRNCEAAASPIDLTTVVDEMSRARARAAHDGETRGEREAAETQVWTYLRECLLRYPTAENVVEYARRVRDHALCRRLAATCAELFEEARSGEYTGAEILSRALGGLSLLDAEQPEQTSTIGEIVKRRLLQLDEIARERALGHVTLAGFRTGVTKLDDKLGGWQPGIVSIVAARPGMGKSALGLATADACSASGHGVHVFSLEDTEQAYADRTISRGSEVPAESIRNCTLAQGQVERIRRAVDDVKRRTGWIVDGRSGITAQEIVRSVRRHKKSNGTRLAIVDYVQLVAKPHSRQTTHEALTEIVTTLADAAKQDQIAYVVMSQLNREIEKRTDRRPQLADLRESGSLEERAKCVVGIYRGAVYGEKPKRGIDFAPNASEPTLEQFERDVQLIVLKNSNGRTGTVHASWTGPTTRLE